MPPVASSMAQRSSAPTSPAPTLTTPVTWTRAPIWCERAAAIEIGPEGCPLADDDATGLARAVAVGDGVAARVAVGVVVGVAVALGVEAIVGFAVAVGVGVGVAVGFAVTVGVAVGDGVCGGVVVAVGVAAGVPVGVPLGVSVWVEVGSGIEIGAGVGPSVDSGEAVAVDSGVPSGAGDEANVGVGCSVPGSVAGGLADAVAVGTPTGEGEAVGPGAGEEARDCGTGFGWMNQSERLSFVSRVLPARPPGRRSRLDFAGGAGATAPSTNEFVAVPHPTASITVPSRWRKATAPPSAASPPEYVASARGPYMPVALATSRCCPGASGSGAEKRALRVTVEPDAVT